jgi:hypothetical protein
MRVSDAFPSKYLKASDLRDQNVRVAIDHADMEKVGEKDMKPVLYFQGKAKGLALNKTNANRIAEEYGDDMDEWVGKEIVLFPAMVDFKGETVEAIRVRIPKATDRRAASTNGAGEHAAADHAPEPPPRSRPRTQEDMDDEIPF